MIYALLIPFWTAGLPGSSIFNIEVTHDQMKFRLIHDQAIPFVAAAAVELGLAAGISMFGFVRDKRETTIFFSLGITRRRLYLNRAASGFIMLAGSIALPMAVSLGLNIRALGIYQGVIRNAVYLAAGILVMTAFSFFAAAAASFRAGVFSEAFLYWAGIMGTPTVLCYGGGLLLKKLCWGNAQGVVAYTGGDPLQPSLLERYSGLNPFLFFVKEMETHAQFFRPLKTAVPDKISAGLLAGWAAALLVLMIGAGILLQIRGAEAAGVSGRDPFLSELVICLMGSLAFAAVFSALYDHSAFMAVLLGLAGFYAVHVFWRRSLFPCPSKLRRALLSAVLQTAPVLLVCAAFHSGLFHSAERFWEKETIHQARIDYVGAPGFLYEEASGSTSGRGYYITSQIAVEQEAEIEKVKRLHSLFLDAGKMEKGKGRTAAETVVPYDICFTYEDGEGAEHFWYYDRASFGQLEQMLAMEDEESVRQQQIGMFTGDGTGPGWAEKAYHTGEIFLSDAYLTGTFRLTLSEENRQQLLAAVGEDLSEMDLAQRYFPEETTRAVLMFTGNKEADCQYHAYHLNNAFLYLTPAYEHTLAWLEGNDLLDLLPGTPDIECIYLQELDPYAGIRGPEYPMGMYFMSYCADTADAFLTQKDFGNKYTVTEEEEIREIASDLQNGFYMSRGGYLAAVKIRGQERYRYLFLPAEKYKKGN